MTVPGETSPAPVVDQAAAEQLFTDIYSTYYGRIRGFLWNRLDASLRHMIDDFAQETFLKFWTGYVITSSLRAPDKPGSLLFKIAENTMFEYYKSSRSRERCLDFSDPATAPMLPVTHTYAPWSPHLAEMSCELEAAVDQMEKASKQWRDEHSASYKFRQQLSDRTVGARSGMIPQTRQKIERAAEAAEAAEVELLEVFRRACHRVGTLRAEMEAKAGADWRATVAMVNANDLHGRKKQRQDGSITGDPSVTHCGAGHELTRTNVQFTESGRRRCRTCLREGKPPASPKRSTPWRPTVPEDVIDNARRMLEDPAYDDLAATEMVQKTGVRVSVLVRRLPETMAARHQRRLDRPAHHKSPKWAKARLLLMDDSNGMTVQDIAEAAGVSFTGIYTMLPEETAARAERRRRADDEAEAKARRMLADPANAHLTLAEIAASVGWLIGKLVHRIPENQSLRPAPVSAHDIDAARRMLADPACTLSLEGIAKAARITRHYLEKHLAGEIKARPSRRDLDPAALETARRMITDPDNRSSLEAIGRSVGCAASSLRRHLRHEVAERRNREAAARALAGASR